MKNKNNLRVPLDIAPKLPTTNILMFLPHRVLKVNYNNKLTEILNKKQVTEGTTT